MCLTVNRAADGLQATVTIDRAKGKVETLVLKSESNNARAYISASAPDEPHAFHAQLRLSAGERSEVLPFRMDEPPGHGH